MNLAQMERIATRLDLSHEIRRHDRDNPTLADDFAFLSAQTERWKPWMDRLAKAGPTNVAGGLMGAVLNPITVNQPTVSGGATELAFVPIALTPIEQNVMSGKTYVLFASGTSTTAATPGTYTFTGRIGPAPTNATTAILGAASTAFTPVASATAAPWSLVGFVTIRGGGSASNAVGSFIWNQSASTGTGGPSSTATVFSGGLFGGLTAATFDSTGTTTALWIGVTHATSTTNTWVQQNHIWCSIN